MSYFFPQLNLNKFLFIGDGKKWKLAFDFVKKEKLNNAQVLPFQSEMMMPYSLALGDISIASLDKGAEGLMVPSKVCYYMASGSAVIGICEGKNDLVNSLAKGSMGKLNSLANVTFANTRSLALDGVAQGSITTFTPAVMNNLYWPGGQSGFGPDSSEWLLYKTPPNATDTAGIEANIMNYYGIS